MSTLTGAVRDRLQGPNSLVQCWRYSRMRQSMMKEKEFRQQIYVCEAQHARHSTSWLVTSTFAQSQPLSAPAGRLDRVVLGTSWGRRDEVREASPRRSYGKSCNQARLVNMVADDGNQRKNRQAEARWCASISLTQPDKPDNGPGVGFELRVRRASRR